MSIPAYYLRVELVFALETVAADFLAVAEVVLVVVVFFVVVFLDEVVVVLCFAAAYC